MSSVYPVSIDDCCMEVRELIPKDKFDIETANKLPTYSYEELKPIIPDLLTWIQDMNWPVSRPVADYLISISEHLTEEIIKILKGDDPQWQYWTLSVFGLWNPQPIEQSILDEVKRIATAPTDIELQEEVFEIANDVLAKQENL